MRTRRCCCSRDGRGRDSSRGLAGQRVGGSADRPLEVGRPLEIGLGPNMTGEWRLPVGFYPEHHANFFDVAGIHWVAPREPEPSVVPSVARRIRRLEGVAGVPRVPRFSEREPLPMQGKYRYSHPSEWV